jgi:hypothetical protein
MVFLPLWTSAFYSSPGGKFVLQHALLNGSRSTSDGPRLVENQHIGAHADAQRATTRHQRPT